MHIWAVILAAGRGTRLASAGFSAPKQFLPLGERPLLLHSATTFAAVAPVRGLVFVMPPIWEDAYISEDAALPSEDMLGAASGGVIDWAPGEVTGQAALARYDACFRAWESRLPCGSSGFAGLARKIVLGGERRQDSVYNALQALPPECDAVLIHDAARPFASPALIMRVVQALQVGHPAVIPGIAVTDTIKAVFPCRDSKQADLAQVECTYNRDVLRAVQTPQGFFFADLLRAHEHSRIAGLEATDDAVLMECAGYPVVVVQGEEGNRKITTPEDFASAAQEATMRAFGATSGHSARIPCTGFGYDVHRYGGKRPFILGGVPVPCEITVDAHSDGDTLLHALMDAMLGCICAGDIGLLFPDTDATYADAASGMLLAEVFERCSVAGLEVLHVDITVVAQTPRIAPFRANIADNVAKLLHLPVGRVNVKATTEEKLGFTGEKKGIKVMAVVTGTRPATI